MRWPAAMLLLSLGGCLYDNPAYDSASAGSAGGTTGEATAAPTSGDASASSGDLSAGTDASGSSTGAPAPVCLKWERLPLAAVPWDTGVVPSTMPNPCPWGEGDSLCGALNFGKTAYFRLVNDVEKGQSAALLAFPRDAIEAELGGAGHTLADVVGFYVAMVVWEPAGAPGSPLAFGIGLLGAEDATWYEGNQDAAVAQVNDSSFECKRIDMQGCVAWSTPGGPSHNVTPLGALVITPEKVLESDEDQNPAEYHARIVSDPLPAAPVLALWPSADPTFVVTVTSDRAIEGPETGIKLKEADWTDPALLVDVCTLWE